MCPYGRIQSVLMDDDSVTVHMITIEVNLERGR